MIDFILAVEDPLAWHKSNMKKNPSHYSSVRFAGPHYVAKIQDSLGAKIYFNTLVPTEYGLIKYGVISKDNFISDLLDWDTLYVAGRLHKPVNILYKESESKLDSALKVNLCSALHTALLLLPETFTEQQLYTAVAGISYVGDFRMLVGENPNKVHNIVGAQMEYFRQLYEPVLQDLRDYVVLDEKRLNGQQDTSSHTKHFHLSMLPKQLQYELVREWNRDGRNRDLEDVLRSAALDPDSNDIVIKGISRIVKLSSISQGLKGILTAGVYKSFKYSFEKLKKMWKGMQK